MVHSKKIWYIAAVCIVAGLFVLHFYNKNKQFFIMWNDTEVVSHMWLRVLKYGYDVNDPVYLFDSVAKRWNNAMVVAGVPESAEQYKNIK